MFSFSLPPSLSHSLFLFLSLAPIRYGYVVRQKRTHIPMRAHMLWYLIVQTPLLKCIRITAAASSYRINSDSNNVDETRRGKIIKRGKCCSWNIRHKYIYRCCMVWLYWFSITAFRNEAARFNRRTMHPYI